MARGGGELKKREFRQLATEPAWERSPATPMHTVSTERKPVSSLHKSVFVFSAVWGPGSAWGGGGEGSAGVEYVM